MTVKMQQPTLSFSQGSLVLVTTAENVQQTTHLPVDRDARTAPYPTIVFKDYPVRFSVYVSESEHLTWFGIKSYINRYSAPGKVENGSKMDKKKDEPYPTNGTSKSILT